jgi:sterol desaturase/sphingolipid hydroxylase (fatty acid hydroxylase superfamily)
MEQFISELLSYTLNPGHRTYYLYMLSSLIMALIFLWYQGRKNQDTLGRLIKENILNKEHWLSESAFSDYGLLIINILIKIFILTPFFLTGISLAVLIKNKLVLQFGFISGNHFPDMMIVFLYTIAIWLGGDFTKYVLHWLCHRIPLLWHFHKIHHSATSLNPFTEYRQHPVEMILFYFEGTLIFAFITGIFFYVFPGQVNMWEVLGVNLGRFLFNFFGGNLRHSHIALKYYDKVELFILSPMQHQIHHSQDPEHFNKNLGSQFALWDWMFGTLKQSKDIQEPLSFGLGIKENKNYTNSIKAVWTPIQDITSRLLKK